MKSLLILCTAFILTAIPFRAQAGDEIPQRLLQVQLEYAVAIASGVSADSSSVKSLKAEIDAISAIPNVKSPRYWEMVADKKKSLEADLAKLTAAGKGVTDADVQNTNAQLTEIAAIEKTKT